MSNPSQKTQYPVVNFFSNAVGLVIGMLATMPVYHATHGHFYGLVLRYAHPDYHNVLEIIWIFFVFYLLFTAAWLTLALVLGGIHKLALYLVIKINRRTRFGG